MNDSATAPERWLPITGYQGLYEVSDLGRVRSLDRDVRIWMPGTYKTASGWTTRHYKGRILKTTLSGRGYPAVGLSLNGVQTTCLVHLLVLAEFAEPCPVGQEACHGPGGKPDASLLNLSWGTRSKNVGEDRLRDGQSNRGERHGASVISEWMVREIRRRVALGERQVDLAYEFKQTKANVWAVVHRKSWYWLDD